MPPAVRLPGTGLRDSGAVILPGVTIGDNTG